MHKLQSVFSTVTMFRCGFQYNLRGLAWAVGSCSISPPAEGTFQNGIFLTLRQSGKNALYVARCPRIELRPHLPIHCDTMDTRTRTRTTEMRLILCKSS